MKFEIDLTYKCNLECKYCNRWCDFIYTNEHISLACSIDRIFGLNLGLKHYPSKNELEGLKEIFCSLCYVKLNRFGFKVREEISPTWTRALKSFNKDNPVLTKI